MVFIVVETTAPYAVALYTLAAETVHAGRIRNRRALQIYAECSRKNEWPGFPALIQEIDVPKWAI